MPIFLLDKTLVFPDPSLADVDTGILAVGGDLSAERLLNAYRLGIFPWYDEATCPILWHSPAQRFVLEPGGLRVNRSLRKALRRGRYEVRYDRAFVDVLRGCAEVPRPGQGGTWLNGAMRAAYVELHRRGYAHSAEAWLDDRLVGGLYGVTLGTAFFGESMFTRADDASKVAFVTLMERLASFGYTLVDCQVYTDHLANFGAVEWPRRRFQRSLSEALRARPTQAWPTDRAEDPPPG